MAEKDKPLVGITGPRRHAVGPRFCIYLGLLVAGAKPVQLRPGHALPARKLDGIVISGGHDVEPVLYKAKAEVVGNYDPERDKFELEMIDQALAARIPVLGICRGAQLLNVALGGNLFQDLRSQRKLTSSRRTLLPLKRVNINQETLLYRILAKTQLRVNSLHNQSIDRTGVGLKIAACDRDKIVQAVESDEHSFTLGVQWHPEFLLYMSAARKLFSALVAAARTQAAMENSKPTQQN